MGRKSGKARPVSPGERIQVDAELRSRGYADEAAAEYLSRKVREDISRSTVNRIRHQEGYRSAVIDDVLVALDIEPEAVEEVDRLFAAYVRLSLVGASHGSMAVRTIESMADAAEKEAGKGRVSS